MDDNWHGDLYEHAEYLRRQDGPVKHKSEPMTGEDWARLASTPIPLWQRVAAYAVAVAVAVLLVAAVTWLGGLDVFQPPEGAEL